MYEVGRRGVTSCRRSIPPCARSRQWLGVCSSGSGYVALVLRVTVYVPHDTEMIGSRHKFGKLFTPDVNSYRSKHVAVVLGRYAICSQRSCRLVASGLLLLLYLPGIKRSGAWDLDGCISSHPQIFSRNVSFLLSTKLLEAATAIAVKSARG